MYGKCWWITQIEDVCLLLGAKANREKLELSSIEELDEILKRLCESLRVHAYGAWVTQRICIVCHQLGSRASKPAIGTMPISEREKYLKDLEGLLEQEQWRRRSALDNEIEDAQRFLRKQGVYHN